MGESDRVKEGGGDLFLAVANIHVSIADEGSIVMKYTKNNK